MPCKMFFQAFSGKRNAFANLACAIIINQIRISARSEDIVAEASLYNTIFNCNSFDMTQFATFVDIKFYIWFLFICTIA